MQKQSSIAVRSIKNFTQSKTHFKAATSVFLQNSEGSLRLQDETCREIVKDVFQMVGQKPVPVQVTAGDFSS